jgi:hypothetical protein|tara:strand:- start:271 stop:480 length:210 start_codon:yes stop_codon:yes gene_type:complete
MFRYRCSKGGSGKIFIDDISIKRSDCTEEYKKIPIANPGVAKAIKEGKISEEKVTTGIRSRKEEKLEDK